MRRSIAIVAAAIAATAGIAAAARADQVVVESTRDNTLYENLSGSVSNGAGDQFFAGQASGVRRGLVAFDLTSAVPSGATIEAVALTLHCSRAPAGAGPTTIALHRVLADWGEGGSDAGTPGGDGAPAQTGDATWVHTFFSTDSWSVPGGDFAATESAALSVAGPADYVWDSTAALVADVQAWIDDPGSNAGWILIGVEGGNTNSRAFDTHEHPTVAVHPRLAITFTPPVAVVPAAWTGVKALFR
jgi:hypothetical protein